jgi:hypothetical protein
MSEPQCQGCRELLQRVAELEAIVRDLQARLGLNSRNSSLPPSANPLGTPPHTKKKKSKRRRGGQPGHPPHLKELLPPERVAEVQPFLPRHCEHCSAALPTQPGPDDPPPTRFQTIELPPLVTVVTEYQGHARTCPECGEVTRAVIPREIRDHSVGPRLSATLSYFSGCHGVSKRGVEEIAAAVFDAPLSLGTVANLELAVDGGHGGGSGVPDPRQAQRSGPDCPAGRGDPGHRVQRPLGRVRSCAGGASADLLGPLEA